MQPWLTWILVTFAPAAATAVGLGLCRLDARRPHPPMPAPAGPWIEATIRSLGLPLTVDVVPAEAPDAYWPNVRTLTLSERTWGGTAPRDWAIASHELGHAQLLHTHAALPWVAPAVRLTAGLAWRGFLGVTFAAVLLAEPSVLDVAWALLAVSVAAGFGVLADEAAASRRAWHTIRADARVAASGARRAASAMWAAGGAYALGVLAQLGVLAAWPWVSAALGQVEAGPVKHPSHLAIWLVIAATPVVAVRAALALYQVVLPIAVPTDLDLWAVLQRDSQWEWATATTSVAMAIALAPALDGPTTALAVGAALMAAMGAFHALVLAAVTLPGVVWRRFTGEPRPPQYLRRARDDVPQAMMATWSDPPWYLRVAWLIPLGYVPLVVLVSTLLLG